MAKKTLINADMLLATPRRIEPVEVAQPKELDNTKAIISPLVEETTKQETIMPTVVEMAKDEVLPPAVLKKTIEANSVKIGLKVGETRATFIVKEDSLEKIKAIAYWDRLNIKDVIQAAIDNHIALYEQTKGKIQEMP